jgi:hypothetical protein
MREIMLCFATDHQPSIQFATEYWASDDSEGWHYTVKEIAERWAQPQHKIAQIAGQK